MDVWIDVSGWVNGWMDGWMNSYQEDGSSLAPIPERQVRGFL